MNEMRTITIRYDLHGTGAKSVSAHAMPAPPCGCGARCARESGRRHDPICDGAPGQDHLPPSARVGHAPDCDPHRDHPRGAWSAITGTPCPVARCGAPLGWAEGGHGPGYRICGRGHHHIWVGHRIVDGVIVAPGDATDCDVAAPHGILLIRDECCDEEVA